MKIALIKETKVPIDNRVALSPVQVARLNKMYPQHEIIVQESAIRAYSDDSYRKEGVKVLSDVSDCDVLFGIKEANIASLIPNKHYFFFGHIAKMQEYNRPLIKAMINKKITFSDYEYLVDDANQRVCAFGWWAGVVGVYYTLRGYGLKTQTYVLPKPDIHFTLTQLIDNLKSILLPSVKVLITGEGRVSQGAQYVLNTVGATKLSEEEFFNCDTVSKLSYTVANAEKLVKRIDGREFELTDFKNNPSDYESDFMRWGHVTDILITGHFWSPECPVYLSEDDLERPDLRIKMIGDVTCDIMGSIKSTVRSSTHSEPYYDYNPITHQEEPAFSSESNISVMAVDTCPNALALDTSEYFGKMLIEHVFEPLLKGEHSEVIERATIIRNGKLTERYNYLSDFAAGK